MARTLLVTPVQTTICHSQVWKPGIQLFSPLDHPKEHHDTRHIGAAAAQPTHQLSVERALEGGLVGVARGKTECHVALILLRCIWQGKNTGGQGSFA